LLIFKIYYILIKFYFVYRKAMSGYIHGNKEQTRQQRHEISMECH